MKRRFNSVCAIALVIAAGLAVVGVARVRAQGGPPPSNPGQPFAAILSKLDQLIAAVPGDVTSKLDAILGYLDFFNGGNTAGAWNRTFPSATRFVVLSEFNDEAFLDRETGLVWDRHGTINYPGSFPEAAWVGAVHVCYAKTIGMRQGGGRPR